MNQILAGIYGTHGHEKVASEGGQRIDTLSDLALALIVEEMPEGTDLEKVASVHDGVLEDLAFYDLSGRATAQAEYSNMEKMAAAGDWSALEAFYAEEAPAETPSGPSKEAILAELQRRRS